MSHLYGFSAKNKFLAIDSALNGSLQEMTEGSEDATGQLFAEHAIKVQLSAHQIVLNAFQRPLVVGQF